MNHRRHRSRLICQDWYLRVVNAYAGAFKSVPFLFQWQCSPIPPVRTNTKTSPPRRYRRRHCFGCFVKLGLATLKITA